VRGSETRWCLDKGGSATFTIFWAWTLAVPQPASDRIVSNRFDAALRLTASIRISTVRSSGRRASPVTPAPPQDAGTASEPRTGRALSARLPRTTISPNDYVCRN
jgi:hypothetical protein